MVRVILAAMVLLASCCTNVLFLEHLIKASSDSGSLLLFLQFSFIALEGLVSTSNFGRNPRHIPMKSYAAMVVLFFLASTTNNMALGFDIPMPLHMIFKSGSLVANLLLGSILLKRTYAMTKFVSVAMISLGIFICTLITSMDATQSVDGEGGALNFMPIMAGTVLLLVSLLLSARLGIYQETLFLTYGKHSREALFYNHALPLPLFMLLAPSILRNVAFFNQSEELPMPVVSDFLASINSLVAVPSLADFRIPILWQYVIANVITQYFCIRSVFYLASECTSLTVTLIVTLRKFLSLIFSVIYFKNNFTLLHCVGTSLVFLGTLLYADIFNLRSITKRREKHAKPMTKNGLHGAEKKLE